MEVCGKKQNAFVILIESWILISSSKFILYQFIQVFHAFYDFHYCIFFVLILEKRIFLKWSGNCMIKRKNLLNIFDIFVLLWLYIYIWVCVSFWLNNAPFLRFIHLHFIFIFFFFPCLKSASLISLRNTALIWIEFF